MLFTLFPGLQSSFKSWEAAQVFPLPPSLGSRAELVTLLLSFPLTLPCLACTNNSSSLREILHDATTIQSVQTIVFLLKSRWGGIRHATKWSPANNVNSYAEFSASLSSLHLGGVLVEGQVHWIRWAHCCALLGRNLRISKSFSTAVYPCAAKNHTHHTLHIHVSHVHASV